MTSSRIDKLGEAIKKSDKLKSKDGELLKKLREEYANIEIEISKILKEQLSKNNISFSFSSRLKKYISIKQKLKREKTRLSKMQDILGLRIVINDNKYLNYNECLNDINSVVGIIQNTIKITERFCDFKIYDYIQNPKNDGYRCIHYVVQYNNKYYVEIQIRTKIQHLWATTLETMSMLTGKNLKHEYKKDKLNHFFKLSSQIIANIENKQPINFRLKYSMIELKYSNFLRDIQILSIFSKALEASIKKLLKQEGVELIIFELNLKKAREMRGKISKKKDEQDIEQDIDKILKINLQKNKDEALKHYNQLELNSKRIEQDIVLIRVATLADLKENYPNYYFNCNDFSTKLLNIIDTYTNQSKIRYLRYWFAIKARF